MHLITSYSSVTFECIFLLFNDMRHCSFVCFKRMHVKVPAQHENKTENGRVEFFGNCEKWQGRCLIKTVLKHRMWLRRSFFSLGFARTAFIQSSVSWGRGGGRMGAEDWSFLPGGAIRNTVSSLTLRWDAPRSLCQSENRLFHPE